MSTSINLRELAVDRSDVPRRRQTPWLTRYVLPASLNLGFLAILGWSLRDSFLPAVPVTVVPVQPVTSVSVAPDTPLFRAAGWIEPRPTPVFVSALVEGVIERLLVVEGQEVEAGQPIAYLVKRDAEIAVEQAEADVLLRKSQLDSADARLNAARIYWDEPIERKAALSEAEATLAATKTQLSRLPASLVAAESKMSQARKEMDSKSKSEGAIAAITIERARSEFAVATAYVEELKAQQKALENEVVALEKRRDILARQLELKVEEQRNLKEAEALKNAAAAQVRQADAALSGAQLRLDRMTVKAPISGKVLGLIAKPGSRLMGLDRAALTDASTVISMYDPKRLQIRADVRLENVPRVQVGQLVKIETPALSSSVVGTVLAMTSLTDIQKNTLQVKIAIDDPPHVLKPDMLVEATFLAPPDIAGEKSSTSQLRLLAATELIDSSVQPAQAWVADLSARRARKKSVQLGAPQADGMIEIVSGLSVGDRLIASNREALTPDCRIEVRGEARASQPGTVQKDKENKKPQRLY